MTTNFVEELKMERHCYTISCPERKINLPEKEPRDILVSDPYGGPSLHIGSLIPIIILMHFSKSRDTSPLHWWEGATGMIGDPSGKSAERNLLDETTLYKNIAGVKSQLERFLDFDSTAENAAELVNNYGLD